MADPRLKQLTIKTGVLRRIAKEKVVYAREADAQRARIERIKSEGKDEHVVRKEEEVLQECLMMIPECERRLKKALEDLTNFLQNEIELKETEQYTSAETVINEVKELIAA